MSSQALLAVIVMKNEPPITMREFFKYENKAAALKAREDAIDLQNARYELENRINDSASRESNKEVKIRNEIKSNSSLAIKQEQNDKEAVQKIKSYIDSKGTKKNVITREFENQTFFFIENMGSIFAREFNDNMHIFVNSGKKDYVIKDGMIVRKTICDSINKMYVAHAGRALNKVLCEASEIDWLPKSQYDEVALNILFLESCSDYRDVIGTEGVGTVIINQEEKLPYYNRVPSRILSNASHEAAFRYIQDGGSNSEDLKDVLRETIIPLGWPGFDNKFDHYKFAESYIVE